MRRRMHLGCLVGAIALASLACASSDAATTLTLVNDGHVDLVPYPVVTTPPPPHREKDPSGLLPHGGQVAIDVDGFNPLYYHEGSKRGFILQLALKDSSPQLLLLLYQYKVEPGMEGSDPALQPAKLGEQLFEPSKSTLVLTVGRPAVEFPATLDES